MAQKHYLLFGTHGTELMPRRSVFVALRVSTVFCVLLIFFAYDSGGGEELVCLRSNEATTDARLVFIVEEGLGIDPAFEFGEVAVPFHQRLRSSTHLAALRYRFHAVHFLDGYLLQLRFVEGSVQHFTEIVDESVHGRIGGMNLVYHEYLLAPICLVASFVQSLNLTDAHAIRRTELGHALTTVTVQALQHLFLILRTHL